MSWNCRRLQRHTWMHTSTVAIVRWLCVWATFMARGKTFSFASFRISFVGNYITVLFFFDSIIHYYYHYLQSESSNAVENHWRHTAVEFDSHFRHYSRHRILDATGWLTAGTTTNIYTFSTWIHILLTIDICSMHVIMSSLIWRRLRNRFRLANWLLWLSKYLFFCFVFFFIQWFI